MSSHLAAIRERLARERQRLAQATTERERQLRAVWVAQAEREEAAELAHLGPVDPAIAALSDDDLLNELHWKD
ncbi:MAG TPA: hypothetical protein VKR21_00395 [Solirubrobacteraceae bacterium]|nr:hypothetical protein [Solirubrobacteraceae bacterium]